MSESSVILQRAGMVPEVKGPWSGRMLEESVRELYRLYPDAVVIVMSEKLPVTCWPQYGREFLAIADSQVGKAPKQGRFEGASAEFVARQERRERKAINEANAAMGLPLIPEPTQSGAGVTGAGSTDKGASGHGH